MNLIDENVILSAAKSYSKIGETNRYDCDKLDAFIKGALEAQQQLQPFIVEFVEWCAINYLHKGTSRDGKEMWIDRDYFIDYKTTQQLLEEFINFKTK